MFLRGIKFLCVSKKQCLEGIGLKNVVTFLQTGNVIFDSLLKKQELKSLLEANLGKPFILKHLCCSYVLIM
ncbi:DUF1697 domain-containing protein [Leptospira biflexa]